MTASILTRLQEIRESHARRRVLWRELSAYTTTDELNDIEAAIARSGARGRPGDPADPPLPRCPAQRRLAHVTPTEERREGGARGGKGGGAG